MRAKQINAVTVEAYSETVLRLTVSDEDGVVNLDRVEGRLVRDAIDEWLETPERKGQRWV